MCKWLKDEVCVNSDCPAVADFCPVVNHPGVCRYEEMDGRLVVLPCKMGQRVFALLDTDKHISECEVKQIGMGNESALLALSQ